MTQPSVMPRTARGSVRDAVVRTSREVIAESGVDALSVADVARRLGVSTAAPYRHFGDRADLIAAVLAAIASDVADAMRSAVDDVEQPAGKFPFAAAEYARQCVVTHLRYADLFGAAKRGLATNTLRDATRAVADTVRDAALAGGAPGPAAASRLTEHVLAAVGGLVDAYLAGALEPGTDVESVAARAMDLARALAPRPRRRPASAVSSVDVQTSVVDDERPALF